MHITDAKRHQDKLTKTTHNKIPHDGKGHHFEHMKRNHKLATRHLQAKPQTSHKKRKAASKKPKARCQGQQGNKRNAQQGCECEALRQAHQIKCTARDQTTKKANTAST